MKRKEPMAKSYDDAAKILSNYPNTAWSKKRSTQLINRLMRKFGIR